MNSYNELITLIDAVINRNGVQAITGQVLNGVLKAMVQQLGAGYSLSGVAHPTDDPGTPEQPVCYFASDVGTYTNFGGVGIVAGELALLCYDMTYGWFKETMYEGFASVGATIDGNVGIPSVNVTYVDGVLSFDFSNLKGESGADGNDGQDGAAAGFGTITASVDANVGTPSVAVTESGPDTAKNLAFAFHNLKGADGEPGVTSVNVTVDNTSGSPACAVSLNAGVLTLAFTGLKGAQGDTGSSVDYPFTIVNNLTTDDATQALSAAQGVVLEGEISQLEAEVGGIDERTANLDADEEDALFVTDSDSNIIAKIDKDGVETTSVRTKQTNPLFYKDKMYITDAGGNVILTIDSNGIKTTKIEAVNVLKNDWLGKKVATYGDSVTAVNNGDFEPPYVITQNNWGNRVAEYFNFGGQIGRGIGSTCFMWRGTSGGQVAWCKTDTGEYVNRNDSYTYDNYEGHITIPADCTPIRGDGCSWLRIVTMFPEAIKDTIDAVLVMFHNDYHHDMDTAIEWIPGSSTDPEWAASDEYEVLGGDYNIGTVQGGIASVVMKLQAWMPQARIILMTPISGVYATDDGLDGDFDNTQSALMHTLAGVVKDIASRMSIPVIDNYSNDGINSLNRTSYIYDNIHPYTAKGSKALAASVIGQMKTILPAL